MTLELICNRSKADADRLEFLAALIDRVTWDGLTDTQKAQWDAAQKGAYNHTDRNRVGAAIAYIAARLTAAGYSVPVLPKTDWAVGDIPSAAQMAAYLADVATIRAALAVRSTTPPTPLDMDDLTVEEANDIERILVDMDELITKMIAAYRHAGTFYAGQGGLRI